MTIAPNPLLGGSQAVADLGLGSMTVDELKADEEERRKKKKLGFGDPKYDATSPSVSMLLGGGGF